MKTERRHELQHNALADSLGHWIDAARPYKRLLTGLAIAAVALAFGIVYTSAQSNQRLTQGWDDYFQAFNSPTNTEALNKFDDLSDDYSGTPIAFWSKLAAADIRLIEGTGQVFRDKPEAKDQIKRAAEGYESVYKQARDPLLQQRALYGLARAHESLNDLPEAQKEYQELAKRWPEGAYSEQARRRASDLERDTTRQFYDWFAKYESPKGHGMTGIKPDFSHDSLDNPNPDIKLPSIADLLPAADGLKKKEEPAKEEPAKEEPAKTESSAEPKIEAKDNDKAPTEKKDETSATPAPEEKKVAPADKTTEPAEPELKAPAKADESK